MINYMEHMARWLRRVVTASGRHRADRRPVVRFPSHSPYERPALPRPIPAPTVRHWYALIDGTGTALVRPYLTAHEREEKARIQRLRRDILWCATYGVDLDARDIHACLGAAS
ncbi:hypothetical protein StrepF001_21725 [Streptomyces sp. F001]|uniref:hypothetical protein n=1 Tax=Streptomyces sp. F001 TaxID=1510026 RepID=UPI00101E28E0|nr:hypothetical protein [Streptomyces sp. F001]RZB17352.1 hypothetical protein StrepF001_21725 [Streptomyces sp. F001]